MKSSHQSRGQLFHGVMELVVEVAVLVVLTGEKGGHPEFPLTQPEPGLACVIDLGHLHSSGKRAMDSPAVPVPIRCQEGLPLQEDFDTLPHPGAFPITV